LIPQQTLAEATKLDEDKPGLGQYYCISCARYFISTNALQDHFQTKRHKKRSFSSHLPTTYDSFREKELKTKPYSTEEAYLPVDNGKKRAQKEELTTLSTMA
jgi:hypothetical protein